MSQLQEEVLGGIIQFPMYERIKNLLKPHHFSGTYREIYERYLELSENLKGDGIEVDQIVLYEDLKSRPIFNGSEKITAYWITGLLDKCVGPESLLNSVSILRRENKRERFRSKIKVAERAVDDNDLEFAQEVLRNISEDFSDNDSSYNFDEEIATVISELQGEIKPGLNTGFESLDKITGGFQAGNLIVIGGRTSHGKTSLAVNFAYNMAFSGKKVLFASLEMIKKEMFKKIISLDTRIPYEKLRSGWLTKDQRTQVADRKNTFYNLSNMIIADDLFSLNSIHESVINNKPDVVIVDFIQYMHFGKGESRNYQIEEAMKGFKHISKLQHCVFIVLSQVRRDSESGHGIPHLQDLKGSGALEEQGDVVMFIHWPHKFNTTEPEDKAILAIAKNRHGRTGKITLKFDPNTGKYSCDN